MGFRRVRSTSIWVARRSRGLHHSWSISGAEHQLPISLADLKRRRKDELTGRKAMLNFARRLKGGGRNLRLELGIVHEAHHPILHPKRQHPGMKALLFDFGRDFQKRQRV